ncbi:unnamed protein product, partial [Ilex paraguariensis]
MKLFLSLQSHRTKLFMAMANLALFQQVHRIHKLFNGVRRPRWRGDRDGGSRVAIGEAVFEPGETRSILEEAKTDGFPFKESVVMAVDSRDPFVDFKSSMEEMVEAHGLKDWEGLEELLS